MVNINLHKDDAEGNGNISEVSFWKSGTFIAVILLVISFAIFGAQLLYKKQLADDEANIIQEIAGKKASLGGAAMMEIKDFDERIMSIDSNLSSRVYPNDALAYVERTLIKNVYIDKYDFDDGQNMISVDIVADNYNLVASQILNFKKAENFTNINISGTNRNEDGKITLTITMQLAGYTNPENKS